MEFQWQASNVICLHSIPFRWSENSEIFCTWSARHALSHPRISVVYSWNVDGEQVTSLVRKKTPCFHPHMIRGPQENPITVHLQDIPNHIHESYPRVSMVYSWKCGCSSKNKFYRRKETVDFRLWFGPLGQNENSETKNIPELSFESACVTITDLYHFSMHYISWCRKVLVPKRKLCDPVHE